MRNTTIAATIAIIALTGCTQIDTGNVGVERSFGKVNDQPLAPGVYATVFDSVDEFTTKEVSFQMQDMRPKSRDNLTINDLDVDVYFKVLPAAVPGLFIKYQGDVVRHSDIVEKGTDVGVVGYNRVLRAGREATYSAVSTFDATTMHTKREELAEAIRKNLQAELNKSDPGVFVVTSINVRNLTTDPAIEKAIRARAETDQLIARKQKEIELARAEAERLRVEAQGRADANMILSQSLTENVLRLRLAEMEMQTIVASSKAGNTIITGEATALVGK